MAIYNGKKLNIEIYGESHSPKIGAKVSGFPVFKIDYDYLNAFLDRRRAKSGVFSTTRKESDIPIFSLEDTSFTSDSFSVEIENNNVKSGDYNNLYGKPRPSHADYSSYLKDGTLDFTGGGRFSGRLTAPYSVIGGLLKYYLESKGIFINAYISQIGTVKGKSYLDSKIAPSDFLSEEYKNFPSLSNGGKMLEEIKFASSQGDSVGGVIEVVVSNMAKGVGDNLFGGLEGKIASLVYSVPAVKGVEFGGGFNLASSYGSKVNDCLRFVDGEVRTLTNNSGGINGGISNGEQITLRVAIKPTPSISVEQDTVDLVNNKNVKIVVKGRHDSCIVVRAVPCIESAVAIALYDELVEG